MSNRMKETALCWHTVDMEHNRIGTSRSQSGFCCCTYVGLHFSFFFFNGPLIQDLSAVVDRPCFRYRIRIGFCLSALRQCVHIKQERAADARSCPPLSYDEHGYTIKGYPLRTNSTRQSRQSGGSGRKKKGGKGNNEQTCRWSIAVYDTKDKNTRCRS